MKRIFAASILLSALPLSAPAGPCDVPNPLPPGFTDEVVLSVPDSSANVIKALPDGRMVLGLGDGRAYLLDENGAQAPDPFVDYQTVPWTIGSTTQEVESEGGILSCAVSPTYATDRWIYIYHTTNRGLPGGRRLQIHRFTVSPSGLTVEAGSSTLIINLLDDNQESDYHSGGGLAFGPDGKLYFSLGDDGVSFVPQQLYSHRGKVLRLNADGSTPTDNPFYLAGGSETTNRIYATGLRNPFRLFYDEARGRMMVTDTGQSRWEELNVLERGKNYGWAFIEGPISDSPGVTPPANYVDSYFAYPHGYETIAGFATVSTIPYTGTLYPEQYRNDYFMTEWGYFGPSKMFRLSISDDGTFEGASLFLTGAVAGLSDQTIDNRGRILYTAANATPGAPIPGQVRRLNYVAPDNVPTANLQATITTGSVPLNVAFTTTVSDDSGAPAICTAFGDGTSSTSAAPTKTYSVPGRYMATLTAEDTYRSRKTSSVLISATTTSTVELDGRLYLANASTPTPVGGTIQFFDTDGFTLLPLASVAVDGSGVFSVRSAAVTIPSNYVIARFSGAGFAPYNVTVPLSGGKFKLTRDIYVATTAIAGTVTKDSGGIAAATDVFLTHETASGIVPYAVPGGFDTATPLPPTGVLHGVRTDDAGRYYIPIRSADTGNLFTVTANLQGSTLGFLSATKTTAVGTGATTTVNLTVPTAAALANCDFIFLPKGPFPYMEEVQDVFDSHCIGCHGLVQPNAGLSLAEGFAYSSIVEVASKENPARRLIDLTSPGYTVDNSWLVEKVRCGRPTYGSIMPPTSTMSGYEVSLIGNWVERYAPLRGTDDALFVSSTSPASPAVVSFRAGRTSSGAPFRFEWDFGNGNTFTGPASSSPFVAASGTESFVVTVRTYDKNNTLLAVQTETIEVTAPAPDPENLLPTAGLLSTGGASTNGVVNFDARTSSDPDGSVVVYAWDFDGDGAIDRLTTSGQTSFTYAADGVYNVSVTVFDDKNATGSTSLTVFVGPAVTFEHWIVE